MEVEPTFGGNGDRAYDVSVPKPVNLGFGLRQPVGSMTYTRTHHVASEYWSQDDLAWLPPGWHLEESIPSSSLKVKQT